MKPGARAIRWALIKADLPKARKEMATIGSCSDLATSIDALASAVRLLLNETIVRHTPLSKREIVSICMEEKRPMAQSSGVIPQLNQGGRTIGGKKPKGGKK